MRMNVFSKKVLFVTLVAVAVLLTIGTTHSFATIPGLTGNSFTLIAKDDYIILPDSESVYCWGYADGSSVDQLMQLPGPTLIVNQNDVITITLQNQLARNVSIVFPGQSDVTATGGVGGLLTREAAPGGSVVYSFIASRPGTYTYYSGTDPELQIEMGLFGVLIVRPTLVTPPVGEKWAYNSPDTRYDYEYLFLTSEMDLDIHRLADEGRFSEIDFTTYFATVWMLNGRVAPDTMSDSFVPWLPNQPYNCLARIHPGDIALVRLVGGGRDLHPYHTHGNHTLVIARDGQLLESTPGAGVDIGDLSFTMNATPGHTIDSLYTWTGEKLGWDPYGHEQDIDNAPTGNFPGPEDIDHNGNGTIDNVALAPNEDPADHGKPIPVVIPDVYELTLGTHYSGSPFLGTAGSLPPGEGGFNLNSGYMFMWHSHNEKEITFNNVFPGGMLTFMIIEPPGVPIL